LTSHLFFIGHLSFVIDPFRSPSLEFSLQVAPAPRQSELRKREGGCALLFATRQRLTGKVVKKSTSRGVALGVRASSVLERVTLRHRRKGCNYSAHDFINAPTYFLK